MTFLSGESGSQRHPGLTALHSEVQALCCPCRSFGCSAHIGLIYSINPLVILTLVPIVGAVSEFLLCYGDRGCLRL